MPAINWNLLFDRDFVLTWLLTSGIRILLILIGSYVLLRAVNAAVGRMEKAVEAGEAPAVAERQKRAKTLGSILRKIAQVAVVSVSAVIILRELGVDITPIITAAGIGGLAIGFGAQNLVRDVISGFFMLMEDQIRLGDVVRINGTGGIVEKITLRTTVLRDLEGTVHVFPNGAITSLSNLTKDWSRYVIDVGVAYKENVDRVMEVLRQIGDELMKDERYAPWIIEPLQVLGVDDFGESQVTIKLMITTQPMKQWEVGRELRRRIKNTFDEKGIEIPFPHVTLYWGEASKPLSLLLERSSNFSSSGKDHPSSNH